MNPSPDRMTIATLAFRPPRDQPEGVKVPAERAIESGYETANSEG